VFVLDASKTPASPPRNAAAAYIGAGGSIYCAAGKHSWFSPETASGIGTGRGMVGLKNLSKSPEA